MQIETLINYIFTLVVAGDAHHSVDLQFCLQHTNLWIIFFTKKCSIYSGIYRQLLKKGK